MDYRTLGRSGCAVSTLALDTMTLGAEADEAGTSDGSIGSGGPGLDQRSRRLAAQG